MDTGVLFQTLFAIIRRFPLDLRVSFRSGVVIQWIKQRELSSTLADQLPDKFRILLAMLGLDPTQVSDIVVGRGHNIGFDEDSAGAEALAQVISDHAFAHVVRYEETDGAGYLSFTFPVNLGDIEISQGDLRWHLLERYRVAGLRLLIGPVVEEGAFGETLEERSRRMKLGGKGSFAVIGGE